MITLPNTLVNEQTIKAYHFDNVIKNINKQLNEYIKYSDNPIFDKSVTKTSDVISNILLNANISVPLLNLFRDVEGLKDYTGKLPGKRYFNSHSGKFNFIFYGLSEKDSTKNLRNAGRKKQVQGLEEYNLNYFTMNIGFCVDSDTQTFSKIDDISKVADKDLFVKFGVVRLLCSQAKFYLGLRSSQELDLYISKNQRYSIKDFFSFQLFFSKVAGSKNYLKLTPEEQEVYLNLMKYKYSFVVSAIEGICDCIISTIKEYKKQKASNKATNNDVKVDNGINKSEAKDDLEPNNEFESALEESLNTSLFIEESYGLPYVVKSVLQDLGLLSTFEFVLRNQKNVDTIVDHVVQQLYESLSAKKSVNISRNDVFKLSDTSDRDRRYHEFIKIFKHNNIDIGELHKSLSKILFRKAIKKEGKLTLLLDSSFIKSISKDIVDSKLTYSNLDGFIKAFKIIMLQTEDGLPISLDMSDASIKDVNDFSSLLLKLQSYNIPVDRLEICADAGYFSEENQVCAQSLGCKYYLMARQVNVVQDSILEASVEERLLHYCPRYRVSLDTKTIKFADYINPNKPYVDKLVNSIKKVNPEYKLTNILDKDILLTNVFNPKKYSDEWERLAHETTTYYESIKHITDSTVELPKCSKKVANLFYFDTNLNKYVQDQSKSNKIMQLLAVATIVSNNTSDPTGKHILHVYKKRMSIENSFRTIKGFSGVAPFRNHFDGTAQYKCFISWITLLVYNYLKTKYNNATSNNKDSVDMAYISTDYDMVDKALETLHRELTMKMNTNDIHDIRYRSQHSKALKDVIEALNLPDPLEYETGFTFVETCSKMRF